MTDELGRLQIALTETRAERESLRMDRDLLRDTISYYRDLLAGNAESMGPIFKQLHDALAERDALKTALEHYALEHNWANNGRGDLNIWVQGTLGDLSVYDDGYSHAAEVLAKLKGENDGGG
jgi:hypothetical protein